MLLFLYHLAIILLGFFIYKKFFHETKTWIFRGIIVTALGLLVSLPLTYLLAIVFLKLNDPIFISVSVFTSVVLLFTFLKRRYLLSIKHHRFKIHLKRDSLIDGSIVFLCFVFSWYIMSKTFKVDSLGMISVARNAVFDFGHSLSIIRSMSWGNNIPYTSPFVAGTEQLYHFMFQFWVAVLEHLGLPIYYAVNIPSSIGFTLFLLVMYVIGKEIFKKISVGIMGIVFIIFHGGFMFIPFFQKYGINAGAILRNPNYLFTGPFDGSLYSLFFTLNVFINQRQLGISLAIFFLVYVLFQEKLRNNKLNGSTILFFAFLLGLFTLWHLVLTVGLFMTIVGILLYKKKWKESFIFVANALFIGFIFVNSWMPYLIRGLTSISIHGLGSGVPGSKPSQPVLLWLFKFIVLNFGLSLLFLGIGIFKEKKLVNFFSPLFILVGIFSFLSIRAGVIDQKYINVLLVLVALFTAAGVGLLVRKIMVIKVIAIIFLPCIILSGIIDFMVIKNDYMFPVEQTKKGKLVSWIADHTEKNAIFLSYDDIFDPVTLAGRKNYYGFYKQPDIFLAESDKYRRDKVRNVFDVTDSESLTYAVKDTNVDYILLPPYEKKDNPFTIDRLLIKKTFPVVYDQDGLTILDVRKK